MRIYKDLESFNHSKEPLVIALGNFDGVHLGHQYLINVAKEIAEKIKGETVVFTFHPHPQLFFNKNLKILNTLDIKIELIRNLKVDNLLLVPFDENISYLSPEEFVYKVLHKKLNAKHLVCGFNYSFGYKGKGKAEDLVYLADKLDIKTTIVKPYFIENELVSSSLIRKYIKNGDIEKAGKLLGYHPKIRGKVIHGNKIGRTLGFPTANLKWNNNLLLPNNGVYAVGVKVLGLNKKGILNIGFKPTVTHEKSITMEVYIFDFSEDIYGSEIEIIFYKKLREEKKFTSLTELKKQISKDISMAYNYFQSDL